MSVKLNLCKVNLLLNAEIKRVNKFSDKINDNKYNKIIKGDQIKKFNNELNLLYEYHKRETEKKEKIKLLNSLKKKSKFSFLMIDNIKGSSSFGSVGKKTSTPPLDFNLTSKS